MLDGKMSHQTCKELEHINKIYNPVQIRIKHFGVSEQFAKDIICNLSCFANRYELSGPDLISNCDKRIIGIEHYEYDASRKTRRGSEERREVERANSEFLKKARIAAQEGKNLTIERKLNAEASIDTLKSNFLENFKKHHQKINNYKKNLEKIYNMEGSPVWFVAEDTSISGPMFNHGSTIIHGQPEFPLLPILYEDIQKEILDSNIDGIIILSNFPISNYAVFIKNKPQSFKDLVEYYAFSEDLPIRFFNDLPYEFHSFCASNIKGFNKNN